MRELHARARAPSDLEVLLDGIEKLGALVADVARIEAALFPHDGAEGSELVGVPEGARRIDEPGGETDRAFIHRLREQRPHPGELGRGRSPRVPTHDARAKSAVTDE